MRFLVVFVLGISFLPFLSNGQSKWETIRMDEHVSFKLPADYKRSDTLGQANFLAQTDIAYFQVVKIPQPQARITNKKELIDYYIAFQKITIDQNNGDLVSDSTIELNDLHVRDFKFENYWDDSLVVQENIIFLVNNSMYSFTYSYFKSKELQVENERKIFFSSIDLYDVDSEYQLTLERNKSKTASEIVGYVLRYITIATALLAIILFFLKRYRLAKLLVTILSLGFLAWGAVCVMLYIGNLFMGNKMNSLLIPGVICLVVGFALQKVKSFLAKRP
jgi:hypothetical protein